MYFDFIAGEEKTVVCTLAVLERGLTVYDGHIKIHFILFILFKIRSLYIFRHKLKTV